MRQRAANLHRARADTHLLPEAGVVGGHGLQLEGQVVNVVQGAAPEELGLDTRVLEGRAHLALRLQLLVGHLLVRKQGLGAGLAGQVSQNLREAGMTRQYIDSG